MPGDYSIDTGREVNPEQLRAAISDAFHGHDWLRLGYLTLWWLHALTNVASERLRPLLPWEVPFFVLDRNPYRFKWKRRPVGYWVAKLVTLAVLAVLFGPAFWLYGKLIINFLK
ncbi:MAG TPA: hypothetical protein ENK38_01285 [Gammaproteobacteria bacterium]|nr:hypothetical protein [Gammaproteobacteria bacterium]